RQQIQIRLYARVDFHGDASGQSGRATSVWIADRGKQSTMGKRIGYCRNGCGRLHLTESLVAGKKEGSIMHQRPSDGGAELVAYECWRGTATQIKVVLRIERSISV